ncbi:MAG: tRNA (cytidine(34)-2'-O)-methyltransferase [Eggerthellaceae bacterium]|nr:tRNA (cytidine(34)-2'-O)-methyltransferase [Eggerthellaceae bacterium]
MRTPHIHVVLFEPEIPQNAGNIARTCAVVGATLHLVEPLGFRPTQRNIRRAGLDYWDEVEIIYHPSTQAFIEGRLKTADKMKNAFFFTGQTEHIYTSIDFPQVVDQACEKELFLIFGRESAGIDPDILAQFSTQCLRIPMRQGLRSINLSNAVAVGVYEIIRQFQMLG